jgi:hypothetical protein
MPQGAMPQMPPGMSMASLGGSGSMPQGGMPPRPPGPPGMSQGPMPQMSSGPSPAMASLGGSGSIAQGGMPPRPPGPPGRPPGMAKGGPVVTNDPIADTQGNDWFFKNVGTRTVPKQPQGTLRDIADKSTQNVKANLPPPVPPAPRSKGDKLMAKEKKAHGGPIRGRMAEAMGGPKVPGSNLENPLPGGGKGKSAPMKFAKGGRVGKVIGAGAVVRGVRPAKKY